MSLPGSYDVVLVLLCGYYAGSGSKKHLPAPLGHSALQPPESILICLAGFIFATC